MRAFPLSLKECFASVVLIGYILLCTYAPALYSIKPVFPSFWAHDFTVQYAWEWFVRDGVNLIGHFVPWILLFIFASHNRLIQVFSALLFFDYVIEAYKFLKFNNDFNPELLLIQNRMLLISIIVATVTYAFYKHKYSKNGC